MTVKSSITLSGEVLALIDQHHAEFRSRSEFLERAARTFLAHLARTEAERVTSEIIIGTRTTILHLDGPSIL